MFIIFYVDFIFKADGTHTVIHVTGTSLRVIRDNGER